MRKMFAVAAVAATLSAVTIAAPTAAVAQRVAAGFNSGSIPANDDGYTTAISLGFNANFFGTTYSTTYVSNNGYVTFGAGQGLYTPGGLGTGYSGLPIIAAFFADVDTRNAASALTTYGTGTYNGRNAFGATWNGVGYFSSHADKLNKFQIILTDRSDTGTGNFDIYLNYDQIQWETGDFSGGTNGLGGTSAAVGYNAGNGNAAGTFYELPGSRTPGSFLDGGPLSLIRGTNDGLPGQYLFQVRNGNVVPPMGTVPEPASWALMIAGFGAVGVAMRRRRSVRVTYAA